MSRLRANQITNKTANGAPTATNGFIVTGVCTATSFVGNGANLTGIDATSIKHTDGSVKAQAVAGGVNITGNLGVSGVLTYEDVTNVDSIGVITARDGLRVTGIATATAFHGDGSQLTGISVGIQTEASTATDGTTVVLNLVQKALLKSTECVTRFVELGSKSKCGLSSTTPFVIS